MCPRRKLCEQVKEFEGTAKLDRINQGINNHPI